MKIEDVKQLEEQAKIIRKGILEQVYSAQSGHPGGSLSVADILTVLYFNEMNINPENPNWEDRDRLVLSKGHCSPALYSCLANRGYFPVEDLKTFRNIKSYLQGHPDKNKVPGVDMTTGSLGQGLSCANGMAIAGKMDKKDYRVYCILGDGEVQEGQVWEAVMAASHYQLDHLIAFVDNNGLQIDGNVDDVLSPNPIDAKFAAFGWHVQVIDGHDFQQIADAVKAAKAAKGQPSVIVAKTVKGKGVSYMENQAGWHGSAPNAEQVAQAMEDLK